MCSFPAQEDPLSSLGACRKGADRPLAPNLGDDPRQNLPEIFQVRVEPSAWFQQASLLQHLSFKNTLSKTPVLRNVAMVSGMRFGELRWLPGGAPHPVSSTPAS